MAALLHFFGISCCISALVFVLASLRTRMDVAAERQGIRVFAVVALALGIAAEAGAQFIAGVL